MGDWQHLLGFVAGVLVSVVTAPVGISGAVFLLPVQLDVLKVPNPQVTPTNLLYNVVSVPGALTRYRRQRQLAGPLTRALLVGTLPGVVVGALVRVYLVPGADLFRLLAAALLLPIGLFILVRRNRPVGGADSGVPQHRWLLGSRLTALALATGVVGGVYGIGGGSILGPILVGAGYPLVSVAPAALASTFLTSVVGAVAFAVIALSAEGNIAPDWTLGIACGLGGLVGGYLGARLQPHLPEHALRVLLGGLAVGLAVTYIAQTV